MELVVWFALGGGPKILAKLFELVVAYQKQVMVEKSVQCRGGENFAPQSVLIHQWRQPRYKAV